MLLVVGVSWSSGEWTGAFLPSLPTFKGTLLSKDKSMYRSLSLKDIAAGRTEARRTKRFCNVESMAPSRMLISMQRTQTSLGVRISISVTACPV